LLAIWHLREMSRDTRQRIKRMSAAKQRGHRTGENPANWDEALCDLMPKQRKRGGMRGSHKGANHIDLPMMFERLTATISDAEALLRACLATLGTFRRRCASQ
jgi:hypothetical protein